MRRRQRRKSSAAFCVKSASFPPTKFLPGLVFSSSRSKYLENTAGSQPGSACYGFARGCGNLRPNRLVSGARRLKSDSGRVGAIFALLLAVQGIDFFFIDP